MKAYFTAGLPIRPPSYDQAEYCKDFVVSIIKTKLADSPETPQMLGVSLKTPQVLDNNNEEDANYMEDFKDENSQWNYRRSLMSFVDHFAGLYLLQRRSLKLPPNENINLSLIGIRPQGRFYYFPWDVMEGVIRRTCEDVKLRGGSNPVEGEDIIKKIKDFLLNKIGYNLNNYGVVLAFQNLLMNQGKRLEETQYPPFRACIHCESSLATILCQIHGDSDLNQDLSTLFKASPSFLTLILFDHSC